VTAPVTRRVRERGSRPQTAVRDQYAEPLPAPVRCSRCGRHLDHALTRLGRHRADELHLCQRVSLAVARLAKPVTFDAIECEGSVATIQRTQAAESALSQSHARPLVVPGPNLAQRSPK
jgi:hypothetical protein